MSSATSSPVLPASAIQVLQDLLEKSLADLRKTPATVTIADVEKLAGRLAAVAHASNHGVWQTAVGGSLQVFAHNIGLGSGTAPATRMVQFNNNTAAAAAAAAATTTISNTSSSNTSSSSFWTSVSPSEGKMGFSAMAQKECATGESFECEAAIQLGRILNGEVIQLNSNLDSVAGANFAAVVTRAKQLTSANGVLVVKNGPNANFADIIVFAQSRLVLIQNKYSYNSTNAYKHIWETLGTNPPHPAETPPPHLAYFAAQKLLAAELLKQTTASPSSAQVHFVLFGVPTHEHADTGFLKSTSTFTNVLKEFATNEAIRAYRDGPPSEQDLLRCHHLLLLFRSDDGHPCVFHKSVYDAVGENFSKAKLTPSEIKSVGVRLA